MARMPLHGWWSVVVPGLLPIVAVAALKFLAPAAQPKAAGAATTPAATPAAKSAKAAVPPGREEASRYADSIRFEPGLASPFAVPDVAPAPIAPAPAGRPAERHEDPKPELKVTAIAGGRQAMAVVNGKVRRAGDQAADGWTIESIDADAGTVTFRHAEHGVLTVTLRQGLTGK